MIASLARLLVPALGLMATALPALSQGIDIQPSSVEIPAEPGERYRQMLTVTNLSDEVSRMARWSCRRRAPMSAQPLAGHASRPPTCRWRPASPA